MERTILEALGYYLIRLVMFGATAAAGIAVGIKLRKNMAGFPKTVLLTSLNPKCSP